MTTAVETQRALCQTWRTARAGHVVSFVWFGGPYVEVYVDKHRTQVAMNVWDYSTGTARVPYSGAGLRTAAKEWLAVNKDLDRL